jgi:pimeloyl-ACP methyl ester carboxylesterase
VEYHEETPFNSPDIARINICGVAAQLSEALLTDVVSIFNVCAFWGVAKDPAIENTPLQSDIPTLIITGHYDPITPPLWGK